MDRTDLRRCTVIVVCQGNDFYVGHDLMGRVRWSPHIYDAWRTRSMKKALTEAIRLGGCLMLFNPMVNQSAKIGWRVIG